MAKKILKNKNNKFSANSITTEHTKRKKGERKPLPRHKVLLKQMSGNIGKGKSLGKAMRDLGYSETYADNPQRLKETESWQVLMNKHLPDNLLAEKHRELLEAKELDYFVFPKKMADDEIVDHVQTAGLRVIVIRESEKGKLAFYSIPNSRAKKDALDMGYKLKGRYEPESLNLKFNPYSKEQLVDMILGKVGKK